MPCTASLLSRRSLIAIIVMWIGAVIFGLGCLAISQTAPQATHPAPANRPAERDQP